MMGYLPGAVGVDPRMMARSSLPGPASGDRNRPVCVARGCLIPLHINSTKLECAQSPVELRCGGGARRVEHREAATRVSEMEEAGERAPELRDYGRVVGRHRWLIILTVMIAVGAAYGLSKTQ